MKSIGLGLCPKCGAIVAVYRPRERTHGKVIHLFRHSPPTGFGKCEGSYGPTINAKDLKGDPLT